MSTVPPLRVGLVSLGCAKNLVDSELMLGTLRRDGMELVGALQRADVIIVNTCGFIEAAKRQSIAAVLRASQLGKPLILAGCLGQRYPRQLQQELPELAAIVGLNEIPKIADIVRAAVTRHAGNGDSDARLPALYWSGPACYLPDHTVPRQRLTPSHTAYIKIADGCNHRCSFCSIPRIRGRHRSRPMADVLAEARALVAQGVRELNLISQDTTYYGRDTGDGSLAALLRALEEVPGDFWVRVLYTHPAHWTDELIRTFATCSKLCQYVDVPLQHINNDVLRRMRRETDGHFLRDLVGRLRSGIPGVALRTTFIVGFPGETEEQFAELLDFIATARFERLGVFVYSPEDHTPAARYAAAVPLRVRRARYRQVMGLQQRVSAQVLRGYVGRTMRVLVERHLRGRAVGRSHLDAPEVDGQVYLDRAAPIGQFVSVRITGRRVYDLEGEVIECVG